MKKIPKREPRHKLAIDTARYQALNSANAACGTAHINPNDGKDDPKFRRVYVAIYARTYSQVIHDT